VEILRVAKRAREKAREPCAEFLARAGVPSKRKSCALAALVRGITKIPTARRGQPMKKIEMPKRTKAITSFLKLLPERIFGRELRGEAAAER
jgi:hypothetical protein